MAAAKSAAGSRCLYPQKRDRSGSTSSIASVSNPLRRLSPTLVEGLYSFINFDHIFGYRILISILAIFIHLTPNSSQASQLRNCGDYNRSKPKACSCSGYVRRAAYWLARAAMANRRAAKPDARISSVPGPAEKISRECAFMIFTTVMRRSSCLPEYRRRRRKSGLGIRPLRPCSTFTAR